MIARAALRALFVAVRWLADVALMILECACCGFGWALGIGAAIILLLNIR